MDMRHLSKRILSRIDALYNQVENEHTLTIGRYHPSGIGGCMRQIYYKYLLTPELSVRAKGRIVWSRIVESFVEELLKSEGYEIEKYLEKKLDDGIVITGRADAVNDQAVIEVKTVTPTAWDKLPRVLHIYQLNTYMWLADVDTGVLWYFKSDNPTFNRWFIYRYDPAMQDRLLNWVRRLHSYLEQHRLPPARKTNMCKTCAFKRICARDHNPPAPS